MQVGGRVEPKVIVDMSKLSLHVQRGQTAIYDSLQPSATHPAGALFFVASTRCEGSFWKTTRLSNHFQNGSVTLLVSRFTRSGGDPLPCS